MSIQSDGKIIIGGLFTSYNGTGRNYIARLNADGSLDATFNPGTGASNNVSTMSIQSDGKIIIGGDFNSYNGTGINRIARLNADGSLDATFNPGTGANGTVLTSSVQPDGKIIIGGDFTFYNGTGRNRIARLNADGSLDATFNPGTGANSYVYTTSIQSDGKIIIGGNFTSYNGTARYRISRMNADGSLDATFNPGTGANNFVLTTSIQSDGKIIIGGYFTSYNGTGRNRIARLNTACGVISGTTIITNVACFGGTTGAINLTPSGGVGPYTFDWGSGITSEDRTGLTAGTYSVTITDANLCTGTVNVTVTQPTSAVSGTTVVTNVACFGGNTGAINLTPTGGVGPYTFNWGGGVTTEDRTSLTAGTYSVTITDANSCTAIVSATVTEPAAITQSVSASACDSYTLNGQTYTSSGVYTQVLTAQNGCDSTLTLNLTINNSTTSSMTVTECDSYTLNGQTYTASGVYTQLFTNAAGCDSTLTLNLTINNSNAGSESVTECDSYTWSADGTTYTTSGTYTAVLTNMNGCDSMLTLNLTINNSTTSSMTVTECDSYTLNGQTYTASGVYTQLFTNAAGCDSTLTLNLTINNSNAGSESVTECDSYTWSANGTTYTTSGTYTAVLTNMNGCDSLATLNLTINNSTAHSITETACDSYTLNGQTYTASGAYTQILTNAAGCDSTLTLNLTINSSPAGSATLNANNSIIATGGTQYSWINCATGQIIPGENSDVYSPTANGIYAAIVSNSTNCSDTTNCITVSTIGIDENNKMNIIISPNPTDDQVVIQFDGNEANLIIRDMQGKIVYDASISSKTSISLQHFDTGVYLFELRTGSELVINRVVKN